MKKIWVNVAGSFKEAAEFDRRYYRAMSAKERVETMQALREIYNRIKKGLKYESGKRLRRVIRVIQ